MPTKSSHPRGYFNSSNMSLSIQTGVTNFTFHNLNVELDLLIKSIENILHKNDEVLYLVTHV